MAAPTQSSRFWTTGGAGDGASTYTRDQLAEVFRNAFLSDATTQGVFNGLAVSGTASPLTIATGASCVYGYLHFVTVAGDLTIATPAVGTTGWHVVLRADWTAQTVRAVAVRNTDGVSSVPSLTQTAGTTWEIRIASGTITTGGVIAVTDTRQFCSLPAKLTNGRVPFATTGGQVTDSADLTFDDSTDKLLVGGAAELRKSSSTRSNLRHTTASGGATLAVDPIVSDASSDSEIHLFDSVNSSGQRKLRVYKGDGTATQTAVIDAAAGVVTITPQSATAPIVLGANGQNQTVTGLAADPVATLQYRRQGGNASNWSTGGTTDYTPANVRDQSGVKSQTLGIGDTTLATTITFGAAFSNAPIVLISLYNTTSEEVRIKLTAVTASTFSVTLTRDSGAASISVNIHWRASGPQ